MNKYFILVLLFLMSCKALRINSIQEAAKKYETNYHQVKGTIIIGNFLMNQKVNFVANISDSSLRISLVKIIKIGDVNITSNGVIVRMLDGFSMKETRYTYAQLSDMISCNVTFSDVQNVFNINFDSTTLRKYTFKKHNNFYAIADHMSIEKRYKDKKLSEVIIANSVAPISITINERN